jgi:hypothetical protein
MAIHIKIRGRVICINVYFIIKIKLFEFNLNNNNKWKHECIEKRKKKVDISTY